MGIKRFASEDSVLSVNLQELSSAFRYVDDDPWGLAENRLQDPWRRPIVFFKKSEKDFILNSQGKDGISGTADDLALDSEKLGEYANLQMLGSFTP